MIFSETKIKGAFLIRLEKHEDERGFFARVWCRKEFERHGLNADFVQANVSRSNKAGTLRGIHYQSPPNEEAKLVRCLKGAIYDVAVDLRPGSSSFKKWIGERLTAENHRMLYIPEGCAHGYLTLTDHAEVFYPVSTFYTPESERGIRWNDPTFNIKWPIAGDLVMSEKDQSWPDFIE